MINSRKNSGFTLVELVVVMVIVGILSTISVPMYRNYVLMARAQEGYTVMGAVSNGLRAHYAKYGTFAGADTLGNELGIDLGANSYFRTYTLNVLTANRFEASTVWNDPISGGNIIVTMRGGSDIPTEIKDNIRGH